MIRLITILCLAVGINSFGQISEVHKCGLDNNPALNEFEGKYFNEAFLEKRHDFDFSGKKVAVFTGSSGTVLSTKSYYFHPFHIQENQDLDDHAYRARGTQVLVLTEEEKELSGGYDVILVVWSKIQKEGKSRARLIKQLHENNEEKK